MTDDGRLMGSCTSTLFSGVAVITYYVVVHSRKLQCQGLRVFFSAGNETWVQWEVSVGWRTAWAYVLNLRSRACRLVHISGNGQELPSEKTRHQGRLRDRVRVLPGLGWYVCILPIRGIWPGKDETTRAKRNKQHLMFLSFISAP